MCERHPHFWTRNTIADWTPTERPNRQPDYVSESGSTYWYDGDGVVRDADHWGIVASCLWTLRGEAVRSLGESPLRLAGRCEWNGFAQIVALQLGRPIWSLQPGDVVMVTHAPKDRRGRVEARRIRLEVVRVTNDFIVGADGRRYGKSTLEAALPAAA